MVLKTKHIKDLVESDDGLRVSVFIMSEHDAEKKDYGPVDLSWTELSPSEELLKEFKKGLPWEDYVSRFTQEVLAQQFDKIKSLAKMAMEKNVTILGYEEKPEHCHRSLIARACKMYQPELEIILK